MKPGLPNLSGRFPPQIQVPRIAGAHARQRPHWRLFPKWNRDQVIVVRQQAITENFELIPARVMGQDLKKSIAAGVGVKEASASIPAQREVVRKLRDDIHRVNGNRLEKFSRQISQSNNAISAQAVVEICCA